MSDSWYYVLKGNRLGPVGFSEVSVLVAKKELGADDYVWKKGFENWKKVKEVPELLHVEQESEPLPPVMSVEEVQVSFKSLAPTDKSIFVRIGIDRGANPVEYGPYTLEIVKKLYQEKRINAKTEYFIKGMSSWKLLGLAEDFQEIFEEAPPVFTPEDKRKSARHPFVARMFIQNNKKVFEGICRDISVGGMQVLVDDFPGQTGDKISINVHPENTAHHFVASGVIVRLLEGKSGFSFRFSSLNDESRRAIENYINSSEQRN